jgi:hypothetical protein
LSRFSGGFCLAVLLSSVSISCSVAFLARGSSCPPSLSTPPPPPPPPPRAGSPPQPMASSAAAASMPLVGAVAVAARLAELQAMAAAARLADRRASAAGGMAECSVCFGEGCMFVTLCCQRELCRDCGNELPMSRCPSCRSFRMLPLTWVGAAAAATRVYVD